MSKIITPAQYLDAAVNMLLQYTAAARCDLEVGRVNMLYQGGFNVHYPGEIETVVVRNGGIYVFYTHCVQTIEGVWHVVICFQRQMVEIMLDGDTSPLTYLIQMASDLPWYEPSKPRLI